MNTHPHQSIRRLPVLVSGLFIGLFGISAGFAIGRWHPSVNSDDAQHRVRFERALITSVQGSAYRALPPSTGPDPLMAIRNRYSELELAQPVTGAFSNRDNGYVLLMWLGELTPAARQEFLWGLGLVIDETGRRQGDVACAINQFHDAFIQAHADIQTNTENDA